ncbi:hypothetical protein [Dyella subtropica]|uniref:hypothetical protein n=1 Tax=Dyella subtropica TaxID=2992127 RepID=UPI002259CFB8|nr:hypothetical protein [Dyella subtropica]
MLTITHPELMAEAIAFPAGLRALRIGGAPRPILMIKGTKEVLLTARVNRGFKLYVVPSTIDGSSTIGLITAFFDDGDEPLVLRTPMFDEFETRFLRSVLLRPELDVHLFDELGREFLGFRTTVSMPLETRLRLEMANLLPFSYAGARAMDDHMQLWFGLRTSAEDANTISVDFAEPLFPEDIFLSDMRPAHHAYHGSSGHSHTSLVREEPGAYQERDIVDLLCRVFRPDQIFLAPLRSTDKEEIADVMVVTDSHLMLIQAKDSPNTESTLRQTMARKRAHSSQKLKAALGQVKGAVKYVRSQSPLAFFIGDDKHVRSVDHLNIATLVILKELFNDSFREYSEQMLALVHDINVPSIALDYGELNMYTAHLPNEDLFFEAYYRVINTGIEVGQLPRLRFGMIEPEADE